MAEAQDDMETLMAVSTHLFAIKIALYKIKIF